MDEKKRCPVPDCRHTVAVEATHEFPARIKPTAEIRAVQAICDGPCEVSLCNPSNCGCELYIKQRVEYLITVEYGLSVCAGETTSTYGVPRCE